MTSIEQLAAPRRIDPRTTIGTVRLTVSDLSRARSFYERVIGLRAVERDDQTILLGSTPNQVLVELTGDPSAAPLNRSATGLFHLAILMPSRRDLAFALARLASARWPLDGASDHLVSEALYLSDPDGNGIEIYRDRPREEWRFDGPRLQMATLPLDLAGLGNELEGAEGVPDLAPEGTRIGHVHLQVSELREIESFYAGVLGFEVTVRGYPGALFVAAGGYHHHIGLNTWHSAGSGPPPAGSIGLRSFDVLLPGASELERVLERVRSAGLPVEHQDELAALLRDPSGNAVLLRSVAG